MLEGQRATLKCRAIGDPEPVIHWVSPDDRIVANSSRTSSFSNGTLDILVTVARDDGAYTCIAINAAGEATATVDLKIIPLPHRGGAGGNAGNTNPNAKNNMNVTNGIIRTDPGSSDISTGKNGGINNGAGRGGEGEDGKRGAGEQDESDGSRASEGERVDGGSMEDSEAEEEEGRMVGVQGVTSTSAQVRWDLGRLSTAYVVWMYQIQYNCTADETLIYRWVQLLLNNTHYSLCRKQEPMHTLSCLDTPITQNIKKHLTSDVSNIDHLVTVQYCPGKRWVQSFIWTPMNMHNLPKHQCRPRKQHPYNGTAPLVGRCALPHHKNWSGLMLGTWQTAQGVDPIPKFPRSHSDLQLWDVQEPETTGPKGLPASQCQTPQDTPVRPVCLPVCVMAVLATQMIPAQYKAGGFNAAADRCSRQSYSLLFCSNSFFLYMRTQIIWLPASSPFLKGGYPIYIQNSLNIYPLQHDTSVVQLFTLYLDSWIAQGKDEWGDGWRDKGAKVVNNSSPSLCDTRSQQVYRQRGKWEDKWMDVEGIKGTMREEGF